MHAGRLGGRKGRRNPRGDCDLGAGPREAKLAAVIKRQIKAFGLDSGGKKVLEETKEQSRPSLCPHWVSHYLFCMTNRHKTIPERRGALDATRGTEGRGPGRGGEAGGGSAGSVQGGTKDARVPVLGNPSPLESGVLGLGVFYCSLSSLCWVPRLEGLVGHPHSCSYPGLHIGGEVQCVPLQFCEGDGGVLQVVEEDLDLCHDIVGPDVRSRREVCFALHF